LKLSVDFSRYMEAMGNKFFVSSTNGLDVQIYTPQGWEKQQTWLEGIREPREQAQAARKVLEAALIWGGISHLDGDGRLLLPPELRRKLNLEGATCHMRIERDHIKLMTAERYKALTEEVQVDLSSAYELMELHGMG
jgi:DNA-binding transcriptional regulator/RsmH inhibitor MraZ